MPGPKELKRRALRKMAKTYTIEHCRELLEADELGCTKLFLISQGKGLKQMNSTRVRERKSYPGRSHPRAKGASA